MYTITAVNKFRYGYFNWRMSLSIPAKVTLMAAMVGLTVAMAQVRIPLPFTPVPLTGQVLAVLLAGVLLGKWWGGASMALYAGLGLAGIPVFAGLTGGLGATAGYIVGFIPAALFLGYMVDRYPRTRSLLPMAGLMLVATMLYYIPGVAWLSIWMNAFGAGSTGFAGLMAIGVVPFIIGDIIKALASALIALSVTRKGNSQTG